MPRGIREVHHTRVLFGDLGYTPGQNPYKPQGLRKMEDVWIDPDGDGYVSLLPGYTEIHDFTATDAITTNLGMRYITGFGDTGEYFTYPVVMTLHSSDSAKLWWINSSGNANLIKEFTGGAGAGSLWAGLLPGYTYGTDAFVFTSDTGAADLGLRFNIGDASNSDKQGTIGLERPNAGDSGADSAVNGDGAVRGVVKYNVAYSGQTGNDEGALSLPFGEIDAGDGSTIDLTGLPVLGSNKRRLYRTFADGVQPFHLKTLNSTDTDYSDNIADVDLGDLPLKHGDPPLDLEGYDAATWHYGRAYILGDRRSPRVIYFSDPDEPESFYTGVFGNWFSVADGYEDRVLARVPAGLVLLKDHAAYILRGRTPADFILYEIAPVSQGNYSVGCGAPGSAHETPSGLYFYDRVDYAVYRVNPDGQTQVISDDIQHNIRETITDTSDDVDWSVHVNWSPLMDVLLVSTGQSSTSESAMWLYDTKKQTWIGRASYAPKSMSQWNKKSTGALSMIGMFPGSKSGKLYQVLTGTDHGGVAISSPTVGSPTFVGSDPTIEKTLLYVDVLTKPVAGETFDVNWFVDGATTADGTATVTMTGTDSRERHRVNINERGREFDIDVVLDSSSPSGNQGIYGLIYGYTEDTSVVNS